MYFIIVTITETENKFLYRNTDHLNNNCSVPEKAKNYIVMKTHMKHLSFITTDNHGREYK